MSPRQCIHKELIQEGSHLADKRKEMKAKFIKSQAEFIKSQTKFTELKNTFTKFQFEHNQTVKIKTRK